MGSSKKKKKAVESSEEARLFTDEEILEILQNKLKRGDSVSHLCNLLNINETQLFGYVNQLKESSVNVTLSSKSGEMFLLINNGPDYSKENVYSIKDYDNQNISLALVLTERYLGSRAGYRVHGGGFAGTIQVFVPNDLVSGYKKEIEKYFGEGSCHVLKIRKYGGMKVI